MGMIAPALPWIAKAGAGIIGGLLGKKAQSSAMKRSPEETAAIGGINTAAGNLTGIGGQLQQTGGDLTRQGAGLIKPAGNYYQTLLRGSRTAMQQAVAAPTAAITETYRGAERGLERSGIRGAARDVASADLNRDRASRIAGLTTGVQGAAAESLAGIGSQMTGQGISAMNAAGNAYGNAGNLYGGLLRSGTDNRRYGREEGSQMGGAIGGFLFDLLKNWKGGGGKSSTGAGLPYYGPGL
jgi:hypothetical protein